MQEQPAVVIYDIKNDRLRTKVSEACLDYGLERIQYSAFQGRLSRNKRQELCLRLRALLEEQAGKVLIQPVCEKDWKEAVRLEGTGGEGGVEEGKERDRAARH